MTVPTNRNVSVEECDKLFKYKDPQIEIERMYHLKTTIIPIVIGALDLVKKGIQNHLKSISAGESYLQEIQKNSPYEYNTPYKEKLNSTYLSNEH